MKRISFLCGVILCTTQAFSQGNNGGNANQNNNANGTALKWDRQGNEVDTTDFIGTINEQALKLKTNNEERLRITPDGKIGIGMNPLEKLDIGVPMRARQNFKLDGNLFVGGDAEFNSDVKIQGNLELVNLDTVNTLEVSDILVRGEDGLLKKLSIKNLTNIGYLPRTCSDDGIVPNPIWHNGINKLYTHCPEVKVGIGTSSPLFKLDVIGVGRFKSKLLIGNIEQPKADLHILHASTDQNAKLLLIENQTGGILQIDNSGMLRSRRIRVDLETWADYVFEDGYYLRPLSEVEFFIKVNGHLPNVPPAKEIEKEGLDLGEANRILMEKVEELTLYLIEQNKRIEELEKKLIEEKPSK